MVVGIVFVAALAVGVNAYLKTSSGISLPVATNQSISVQGNLITPPASLPGAPPILTEGPIGERLTDINVPLNATELAVINDAPDSYFVTAAQKYLNGTLGMAVGISIRPAPSHRQRKADRDIPRRDLVAGLRGEPLGHGARPE